MSNPLQAATLWADIEAVRTRVPLVHTITNQVVINFNANVLLAAGASPVMALAQDEAADMAAMAQALVLNIGTSDAYQLESMRLAAASAACHGVPTVLDPVGAGATAYRNRTIEAFLAEMRFAAIRGNASEIMSVAGVAVASRGVDSLARSSDAVDAARALAARSGAAVCVSGATDHVLDAAGRHARLDNGDPWMTRITGAGCSATALVGAFCGVQPDAWRATVAAMALLGVAGEVAGEQARAAGRGVGTLAVLLLDALQLMTRDTFCDRLRLALA